MPNPLYDALFAALATRDTRLLILADGSEVGGRAFHATIARAANALRQAGVQPDDRVAVQIAKSPEALAVYAATVAIGAIFLPLNTAYTPAEVGYFLENATPSLFLCDPAKAASLSDVAARTTLMTLDAQAGGSFGDRMVQAATTFSPTNRSRSDLAAILYTSGTTGRSKGAMLTHANLLSNAETLADLWRFTADDILLHALPIFHTHGLFVASNVSLLTGGAMIFLPGFEPGAVLRLMPHATTMMGVPTFYTRLLDDQRFTKALTAHLRLFISGSAPLLAETHRQFHDRTGHRILERYGMTETNMNTSNPYDGDRRAGTVGFPLPGVALRIMADGVEVPAGDVGGIEVRGPNVFAGYWQMPDKTAEDLAPDGWFSTGDLGQFDPDGYLQIVGRSKDLIISGGTNIYPIEVELLLDGQPGVLESAVVGLPHPDFGEAVFAVLVAQKAMALDVGAVLDGLKDKLAAFKRPKAAVVVAELPRNPMGKVQKAELRKRYAEWFSD